MRNTKRVISMILVVCMLLCVLPLSAFAITITDKPENGTTVGQPFLAGTGGSNNFRIPGIVTLDDGTLIATTDARWTGTADAGGLDTLVSVSKDNGANWTYTFANYLGDNGDVWINTSSCIIDPAIGTDGTTAYMIADLFPAGFAINSAKYNAQDGSTGFNDAGSLLLRSDSENGITFGSTTYASDAANAAYGYYLADGKIYTTEGTEVEGYSVDAYFNIEGNGIDTNLFFEDSPYKPFPTDYLYLTTSENGLDWSEPKLLNLKAADEQTLLVGPGNGTYNAVTDHMVFTAYEYDWGTQNTALIWQDTDGQWYRSENVSPSTWTSEATSVVLDDGTVRVFYRDGYSILRYTDMIWDEQTHNYVRVAGATEVATQAAKRYNNQLTSILYSQPIDGKDAILVACASNPDARSDGRLYVFLVDTDNSMELAYTYDIVPNTNEGYAYNCISEMSNGDIALLYEGDNPDTSAWAEIIFTTIDMDEVTDRDNDARLDFVDVTVLTGESYTHTDNSGYYPNPDLSELDTTVATVTVTGSETTTNAAQVLGSGGNVDLDACRYTFTANDDGTYVVSNTTGGTTVYLNHYLTSNNNIPNITTAGNIAVTAGTVEGMFKLQAQVQEGGSGVARTLHFHAESATPYWNRCGSDTTYKCQEYLFRKAEAGETSSTEIPGYVQLTSVDEVVDGGRYLIAAKNDAGNWYVLNPTTSSTYLDHVAQIVGSTTVGYTEVTITGVGSGYTEAQIGSTVYRITAKDLATQTVTVPVGSSVSYTQEGNYANADTSELDTAIATVTLEGSDGANDQGVAVTPATTLADGTYVILNTRAQKLVNNTTASADAQAGAMAGFALSGNITTLNADTAVWTITAVDGGYTVQDVNGKYMTIASNAGGLSDDAQVLHIVYTNGTWTLEQNGAYLNDAAGAGTTASGWQHSSAATDSGSQFAIYAYGDSVPAAGTTVTFTGVAPGTTSLLVDRVRYEITVTGTIVELEMNQGETHAHVVNGASVDMSDYDETVISVETGTVIGAQLGNDTTYSGDSVNLEDCLYTFTKGDDDRWTVTGTDASGNAVYLYPGNTANTGYPHRAAAYSNLSVMAGSEDGSFSIMSNDCDNGNQNTSYLYFDRSNLRWDRVSSPGTNATWLTNTSLYLYRAVEGEGSQEIPGYEKITSLDELTDGDYLIAAPGSNGSWYMAYPSTVTTTRYNQIAKLANTTAVVITAVGEGETTFRVEDTIYNITVAHACKYEAVVTAPTCTEGGYTTYTCSCGDSYVADETPALGHNYENGSCTVCGIGVAQNVQTGETYAALADALAAAEEGQTVQLLGSCTESKVLVIPGVTLDLNGKTLTAGYVVGFDTADVVDNAGGGKLVTAEKNVVLDEGNAMIPVYDGTGYIFTHAGFAIQKDDEYEGTGIRIKALACPVSMEAVELLRDGASDNNIQVMIVLSWTGDNGTGSQKFVFNDHYMGLVYSSQAGKWNQYGQMFLLTINGAESVENLVANIVVVSGTNAAYVGDKPVQLT